MGSPTTTLYSCPLRFLLDEACLKPIKGEAKGGRIGGVVGEPMSEARVLGLLEEDFRYPCKVIIPAQPYMKSNALPKQSLCCRGLCDYQSWGPRFLIEL